MTSYKDPLFFINQMPSIKIYRNLNFKEYLEGKDNQLRGDQILNPSNVFICDVKYHIEYNRNVSYVLTEDTMFEYTFIHDHFNYIVYKYIKDVNGLILYENVYIKTINNNTNNKVLVEFIRGKKVEFSLCGAENLSRSGLDCYSIINYIYRNSSLKDNLENNAFKYMMSTITSISYYEFDYYNDDKLRSIYAKIIKDDKLDQFITYINRYSEIDYDIITCSYNCLPTLFFKEKCSSIKLLYSPSSHTRMLILFYDLSTYLNNNSLVVYDLPHLDYNSMSDTLDVITKYINTLNKSSD